MRAGQRVTCGGHAPESGSDRQAGVVLGFTELSALFLYLLDSWVFMRPHARMLPHTCESPFSTCEPVLIELCISLL